MMQSEQSTLNRIRTRPRFKMETSLSPAQYEANLKQYLQEHKDDFYGNINQEIATIFVRTTTDEYWKPNLSLRSEIEDEKTIVRGIFGPSSAVWTFFMFLYFLWAVCWMTFISLWFVEQQIQSKEFPWALGASFFFLLMAFLTYLAARYGQRKGKDEMKKLRKFAEESTLPHEISAD